MTKLALSLLYWLVKPVKELYMKPFLILSLLLFGIACQEQSVLQKSSHIQSDHPSAPVESVQIADYAMEIKPINHLNEVPKNIVYSDSKKYMAILNPAHSSMTREELEVILKIKIEKLIPRFNLLVFTATSDEINALLKSPLIESVQEDILIQMQLNTSVNQIKARDVQSYGVEGQGVKVCIIDSGMNDHADLPRPANEFDFVENDSRAQDDNGHGTAVAGIIASQHQGTIVLPGYKGVAPKANLLIAKVFGKSGEARGSVIASALDWCADQDADVINMSLGHGGFSAACDTDYTALFSNTTAALGISVVAASGNDGFSNQISSPACGSKVISVGSVSKADKHSYFSNSATILDLTAPGENITTTSFDGGYTSFSGTSAATPFVAGVIALLKSMPENPSSEEIKQALFKGAKDLGTVGRDAQYGHGRVDALESYKWIKGTAQGGNNQGLVFVTSYPFSSEDIISDKFSSSQKNVSMTCPAGSYLADMEIQNTLWSVYRSITWFRLKCQSMNTIKTLELGDKRHAGSRRVKGSVCPSNKGISGMNVVYDRYIKDFRFSCSGLSYHSSQAGNVQIGTPQSGAYVFGFKQRDDQEESVACPANTIAVGIEGSAKTDRNEWAFTRIGLKCAEITTEHQR
jgi:subtilisin family serine protease